MENNLVKNFIFKLSTKTTQVRQHIFISRYLNARNYANIRDMYINVRNTKASNQLFYIELQHNNVTC